MKKFISLMLVASMCMAIFTSCSSTENEGKEDAEEKTGIIAGDFYTEEGHFKGVTALDYVTLPDYNSFKLKDEDKVVTDEELKTQMSSLLSSAITSMPDVLAKNESEDYVVKDGDALNIDFAGTVDGVAFEGGSTGEGGYPIMVGVTSFIDDFIEQLIGHKKGENFDIEVTFPEPYMNEELSGKDAIFNITINYGYELSDEAVTALTNEQFKTVADVEKYFGDMILKSKQQVAIEEMLVAGVEISETPESVIKLYQDLEVERITDMATQNGITVEDYLASGNLETIEDYLAMINEDLVENAKYILTYQAVAEKEGIKVTDEDIAKFFMDNYGTDDWSSIEELQGANYIKAVVLTDVVVNELVNRAL